MNRLILVNYAPPSTSVYKIMMETSTCVNCPVKIVNLQYSNRSGNWNFPSVGTNFRGLTDNRLIVNLAFGRFAFRNAARFIKNNQDEETILHYTHQDIRPVTPPSKNTVIEVHDNPETNLTFGFYTSKATSFVERSYFRVFSRLILRNYKEYSNFPNVIVHSDYVKDALIKFGFRGKITTIYPAVAKHFVRLDNTEAIKKKLNLPLDKMLVLSVASTHHRKNLGTVEKVMQNLGDQYKLVRVGLPLSDSITFRNVEPEVVNELYNACDVLLLPSIEEGFGVPIPEAMTVGLPVVASNIAVFEQTFGRSILTRDPYDVVGLAEAVREAIEEREKIASRGIEHSKVFTFDAFCKRINNYYASVLSNA